MGIKATKNLVIADISEYRMDYSDDNIDIIDLLGKSIIMYKRKLGDKFTCIALDSLGALYSLISVEPSELRVKMYHLFESLRKEGITAFIIFEKPDTVSETQTTTGMEGYIADGVIELGMIVDDDNAMRYLRVRKMRATKHSMRRHIFMIGDLGIKIVEGRVFD
ncbi:MAG: signal transduction protein, partial [Methanosarcinales archaeon]|nr:signal transduction protein [Methanosarcinales archaeon]